MPTKRISLAAKLSLEMVCLAMQDVLTAAIEMHRSGQLAAASQLYQRVLAREQENAEALHLLGVLHHQQGNQSRAIELIGRAVAIKPNSHIYHANLAEAYRALGISIGRRAAAVRRLQSGRTIPRLFATWAQRFKVWEERRSGGALKPSARVEAGFRGGPQQPGDCAAGPGAKGEALEHFQRAVDLDAEFRTCPDQSGADASGSGKGGGGITARPGGRSPRPEFGRAAPQPW